MEERRLRNILSHLSPRSPSQIWNSDIPNAISKAETLEQRKKGPHQFVEQQKAHRFLPKLRSTSNISECRQYILVDEDTMREAVLYPITSSSVGASCIKFPSYSFISHPELLIQKSGGLLMSKTYSSEVVGKVLVDGIQAEQVDHTLYIAEDRKASRDQTQSMIASQLRIECSHRKEIGGEDKTSTKELDILLSSEEQNLLTCKDMYVFDSQPVEVGIDVSGSMTVSRNNVMTGQKRRIVEDCIFCLIVQGQSPAFKLYEDEMCFCILDLHPLSHGHSLLIPKAHFPSLELTPPEVAAAMCATVPFISMAIMQATNCDSFNLLVNSGKAAGQVVFHTHFHIIPRRSGDNLWRSEDGNRRALSMGHETALLVQQIRQSLSNKRL